MEKTKSKYPIGYWVCCLAYTFERFAFYGSKPILLLYLTKKITEGGLGIDPIKAAPVAVLLTSLTYLAPLAGGFICDRFLGARYAVSLGFLLMGLGYLVGWKSNGLPMIYLMILLVSVGTAFFKGNLAAIIGRMFDDKALLDSAFSIQYSFVNIGSFIGSLVCATLYLTLAKGDELAFRFSFFLCAVLVLVGGVLFTLSYKLLQGQGIKPFKFLTDTQGNIIGEEKKEKSEKSTEPLTKDEKKGIMAIILVSAISVVFWLAYYQQDVALTLYLEDFIDRGIGSFTLSPAHLTTTWNGFLCIFLSLAAAKLWAKLAKRPQGDLSMFQKITLAFVFLGLAYVMLIITEVMRGVGAPSDVKGSVFPIFIFGILLTFGEICFSPLGNSFVSKFAPKKYLSLMMGVWIMATFVASQINGQTMKVVAKLGNFTIFVTFAIVAFVCAALMFFLIKPLNKLVESKKDEA